MTHEELLTDKEFVVLPPQKKAFVEAYCTNGANKREAARIAYKCKDDQAANNAANRALAYPDVRALINRYFGREISTGSRDEFLAFLWGRINKSGVEDKFLIQFLSLYADCSGLKTEKAPAPAPVEVEQSVQDLVLQMEREQ